MSGAPLRLLTTKLYRPQVDANWVSRPALLARLDTGLRHKLTLLSAPPGFGKSTLVSQWVEHIGSNKALDRPQACWLALDESDNQLVQFLRYLIAAVRTCEPAACPTTQSLLGAALLPAVEYLADVLVSELNALPVELVLVLDDYHLIRADVVHQVMRHLLRYLPPRFHLVILSRTDPPLHLGRLRIEQQITELRSADLRFAEAETRTFLDHQLAHILPNDALQLLHTRTEGWITALQLSSIVLQHQDANQFLANFHGNNRLLVGYLVEEVMERLTGPVRDFLLRTSIVDRFCAPLADVLWADQQSGRSSQAMIAQVEALNLFIIALDQSGDWIRYHDLFRDFLRHQLKLTLSPATLASLHQAASAWFATAGLFEDALRHALAARDEDAAVTLLVTHLHPMLDRQLPGPTLLRWLALFPAEMLQRKPELLLAQIWLAAFGIGPETPPTQLQAVETMIQQDPTMPNERRHALLTDINLLRGIFTYWGGDPQRARALLQAALDQQPSTDTFAHAQVLIHLAMAHTCLGKLELGRTLLRTAVAEAQAQQRPTLVILLGGLAILHLHAGELTEVIYTATQAVAVVDAAQSRTSEPALGFVDIWYAWAHYLLGIAYFETNDLATAANHWRCVETMRYRTNPSVYQGSLQGLALIAQANRAPSEALAYAQAAHEFVTELRRPNLAALSVSFAVRLALLNGQKENAQRQTQEITTKGNQGVQIGIELPQLTRLYALLLTAKAPALMEALTFAETCLRYAEGVYNTTQVLQTSVRQALILHGLRRTADAFDLLARALRLGESGGFVRSFVELGTPMAELLHLFGATRGQSPYVKKLLTSFPQPHDPAERHALASQSIKLFSITPLTLRELELLALIRQRLSIDEMAATLVISPNTVKKHMNNIYTKLGVRNRREALTKAETLNLLPPV